MRIVSKIIFWLIGWKAIGTFDYPKKCVIIAAPHTSNWDFVIGRLYGYIIRISPKYLIKDSFFVPIIGAWFRWTGGIPVRRDLQNDLVDQIVREFDNSDNFIIVIAPEGTRSRVDKWKTGFYHIAYKAKVPIVLVAMDFKYRKVGIINSLKPSGDIEKDMVLIQNQFKNMQGRSPDNYNPVIYNY